MTAERWLDTREVAQKLRPLLKKAFPDTKFSVKISRYSMGSSISITWMDGPTGRQVDHVTAPYSFSRFDSSQDYARTAPARMVDGELVRASCNISTSRHLSAAACAAIVASVRAKKWPGADTLENKPNTRGAYINLWNLRVTDALYLAVRDAEQAWTEYPNAPTGEEAEQRTPAQVALDAEVRRDIAEIEAELTAMQFQKIEVYQSARGVYTTELGTLDMHGQPFSATGGVWEVIGAARSHSLKPSKPRLRFNADGTPAQVFDMTAQELADVVQAAREVFGGLLPPDTVDRVLNSAARHVNVTAQDSPVWVDASSTPDTARTLN